MKKRYHIHFLCWILSVIYVTSYSQIDFTLEEAVKYGLQNSSQVKLNQLNLVDADAQLMEYKSIGYPKINGTIDYSHFFAIPATIIPDFLSPVVDGRLVYYKLLDSNRVERPSDAGFPAKFGQSNSLSGGLGLNTILYDPAFFQGLKASKLYRDLVKRQNSVSCRRFQQRILSSVLFQKSSQMALKIVVVLVNFNLELVTHLSPLTTQTLRTVTIGLVADNASPRVRVRVRSNPS